MQSLKQRIISIYSYIYFTIKWYRVELSIITMKLSEFYSTHCYAILICNSLFSLLFFFIRLNTVYFENEPFLMAFFDLSFVAASFLNTLVFCFLPAFCAFLYISKKPLSFFATFFVKSKYVCQLFVYIGKIELYHCVQLSSGFCIYFCVISFYTLMFVCCSTHNHYLFLATIRCILLIYISFRACFFNRNNVLIIGIFEEFHKLYQKLMQKNVVSNRIIFINVYFLYIFLMMCVKNTCFAVF